MTIDIFKEVAIDDRPKWFKFTNIGDAIQGTYMAKMSAKDGYGNDQIVYQLKNKDGLYNLGFKVTRKDIHDDMADAKFGQIVGFKYVENRKFRNRQGQEAVTKVIRAVHDPKIIDNSWNAGNNTDVLPTDNVTSNDDFGEFSGFGVKENSPVPEVAPKVVTNDDKIAIISKLAKDKIGVTDQSVMKDRVMEVTGIAFVPVNYDKIISALSSIGN